MASFVGIDLGTTFSAAATLDETGRPQIVHNQEGQNITPSVVTFPGPGTRPIEVGEQAKRVLGLDPDTVGRFKRDMGTDKTYKLAGAERTPTMLSALVLKKLKQDVETSIGPIAEAVVTIPANFANEAREATLAAAKEAGLKVNYIINEPTAAALYYASKSGDDLHGTYAVYDLGGGTFDVSIIKVAGQDVEVIATNGVNKLGGDDFDEAIRTIVNRKCEKETGAAPDESDYTKNDAEEDKKSLSKRESVKVRVSSSEGKANVTLTRAEFEESISALIAQTEMLCEAAVDEADLDIEDIDQVFLAGGSTRIPCVRASVERVFGKEPVATANVDEVVALGAALYAAYKGDRSKLNATQKKTVEKVSVQEITSKCYGTLAAANVRGGALQQRNFVLIRKGDKIPCSESKSFYTMNDGQVHVDCEVTEAAAVESDPTFAKTIWEGELPLPEGRPAGQEIKVTFSYDANQTMKCSFLDVASGKKKKVDLDVGKGKESTGDVNIEDFVVE